MHCCHQSNNHAYTNLSTLLQYCCFLWKNSQHLGVMVEGSAAAGGIENPVAAARPTAGVAVGGGSLQQQLNPCALDRAKGVIASIALNLFDVTSRLFLAIYKTLRSYVRSMRRQSPLRLGSLALLRQSRVTTYAPRQGHSFHCSGGPGAS